MRFLRGYWLLGIFILIGLIFVLFPYNILDGATLLGFKLSTKKYNELGDFVGGITAPVLSMIALVLLYLTYRSQKEELSESRKILKKQSETLDKQQFETTFFNMLNLHHKIVNSIDLTRKKKGTKLQQGLYRATNMPPKITKDTLNGRDCFRSFYKGFRNEHKKIDKNKHEEKLYEYKEMINKAYERYFKRHQSDLGHYFRNLYHIFKLIKKSEIKNKSDYASLVRAQLSSHELLMLFYNGLSNQGKKFKELIEEFQVLKNMPFDDLIIDQHEGLYEKAAYEKEN